ncbi:MAG: hypothetical protein DRG78_09390 [Epsilonproteobacteria bacterium]|nr:MAG: hypothetical protein DRG78_09390 [Campylobacterota bacterium]
MKFYKLILIICLLFISTNSFSAGTFDQKTLLDNNKYNKLSSNVGYYPAFIYHIVDGDTVDAIVCVGFGFITYKRFRIYNLDTPETWRPSCEAEKIHGEKAKEEAKRLLLNKYLIIRTGFAQGYYCRELADIYLPDGTNYSTYMNSNGFAKKKDYKK